MKQCRRVSICVLLLAGALAPASGSSPRPSDDYVLTLGEQSFDPVYDAPVVPAELAAVRSAGADLRLVQFEGRIPGDAVESLTAAGLDVIQYVHPNTYVVWGERVQVDGLSRSLSNVRWTGDFLPAYRLLPAYRGMRADELAVDVVIVDGAHARQTLDEIAALGGKPDDPANIGGKLAVVTVNVRGDVLDLVANIPGVYSVQPVPTDGGLRGERTNQICADNVDGSNIAFPGYAAWLASIGLNGAGVIIANVDSGVQDTHAVLQNRLLPCTGSTCGGTAQSSHGTHTAGIMAGDGGGGVLDGFGFLRGLGVAPGANLVEQLYSPTFTQPGGMLLLMTQSYNNGADLSGNSWGPAGTPKGYDNDTRQVDVGVRDADPNAPGNQPLSFVLSFMNGNGGTSSQGTPDEGKNLFNVGSTKGQNSDLTQIAAIDDLSSNSAHGPALDGRTIPHIVAPGCRVDSSTTTSTYTTLCGTSMASPHVSGAVALFIEYYRGLADGGVDPSPAMVKAAFLAVAKGLAGNRDADNGILGQPFDSKQGWGRMLLPPVLDPNVAVRYWDNPQVFTASGQVWTQTVSAFDPAQPIRIMLVWTDAPGHGLGGSTPAWVNDLDLEVVDGASVYKGNVFSATTGWSVTGGAKDNKNNTEGVFIGPSAPNAYTINVNAANIVGDGIPNVGGAQDQDFAIVCYNCALEPGFTLQAAPVTFNGCVPDSFDVVVNVAQVQGYTDPVDLSADGLPAGVDITFNPAQVVPPGMSTATVTIGGAVASGAYVVAIKGESGVLNRDVALNLNLYNGAPAAPLSLDQPANGAGSVSLRPTFQWTPSPFSPFHEIELSLNASFTNIFYAAAGLPEPQLAYGADLPQGTTFYWRTRGNNPCGNGPWSATSSFTTRVTPEILLVDDDDNGPDVRSYYTAALAQLGLDYDVWDTANSDNEPSEAFLSPYCTVIWFTGDEFGGACGPGAAGEAALQTWLNGGKNLFLTSQDYFYDRDISGAPNAFMLNVLGVTTIGNDVSPRQTTMTGQNVFTGMGPYALTYPFTNFSDNITPNASLGAQVAFVGNNGNAAITRDSGVYKVVFMVVPLETVSVVADRAAVLQRALDWFTPCTPAVCPGDLNCDGAVNFADIDPFVEALGYPGGAGWPYPCPWLSGDTNNDGAVNFGDIDAFVALIGTACP